MSAANVMPKKGSLITIDGKEYRIQFTMKAIGILTDIYGDMTKVFEAFTPMASGKIGKSEIDVMVNLMSAALISHQPQMDFDYVSNNFELRDITNHSQALVDEYMRSMGVEPNATADDVEAETPPKA